MSLVDSHGATPDRAPVPVSGARAVAASYIGVLLFSGIVFVGAGTLAYWQGLLYLVLALWGATLTHLLAPAGSTLAADRAREAHAGQTWDRRLLAVYFLLNLVALLTASLDSGRYGWTGPVPVSVAVAGAGLMLLGQALFAVARRQNAFFSTTVRIQTERGHRVCDTGVYRLVRHPGYLGMLLSQLALPLVLQSYWTFIPAGLAVAVLVARTAKEDRYLADELPGYRDYARRTPGRLVPGVF
ncbi:MAG: isoprenylcysteine carboxylmethyltransferase family protein [Vicinamibacterales bacterium]